GQTWTRLGGGLPAPAANLGRPAVAFAPSHPDVVYAAFADDPGNFLGSWKSTDGGDTWTRMNDAALAGLYSNFGWYFGKVFVHPQDPGKVFIFGVSAGRSTNGGASWSTLVAGHVDHHAMVFDPDPALMHIGTDGGFATSTNGGVSWTRRSDQGLWITQFYAGAIDRQNPARSMGGTQDNGTPRTLTGNAWDWSDINGGDGFYCPIDYVNPQYQYAESQYGVIRRTTDNWSTSAGGTTGISATDRKNWSTPLILDPVNPAVLYTGTQRLYRSTNRAANWGAVSGDLTGGLVPGFTSYATITTIDVAPTDTNAIIAGTDDARVWVSSNRGGTWTNVSAGLPERWVTRVRFDPADSRSAYVTLSGYRYDTKLPHVFRTTNSGGEWLDISGNLPETPVNVIAADPAFPNRLYVGTDVGCFFSTDRGGQWHAMGTGLPNVVVSDLVIHAPTRIARAFTHGRSMWEIPLDGLVLAAEDRGAVPPTWCELLPAYPNPFNPAATVRYRLADAAHVLLEVTDPAGRRVRVLEEGEREGGEHRALWDGRDERGGQTASGVYFCRLQASGERGRVLAVRKLVLLR
ncbi:MAG: FlgD immunoglobulin-like domain containing protein, partial [Bacteroidota bacterium]